MIIRDVRGVVKYEGWEEAPNLFWWGRKGHGRSIPVSTDLCDRILHKGFKSLFKNTILMLIKKVR